MYNLYLILFKRKDSTVKHDINLKKFNVKDTNYFIHDIENDFISYEDVDLAFNYLEVNNLSDKDLVVFLDEKAITSQTNNQLSSILEEIEEKLYYYDIFYLANFMDNCSNFHEIESRLKNIKFHESYSPNGFYCNVTNYKKWKKISNILSKKNFLSISERLSESVLSKEIKAATVWPRVFVPDIESFSNQYENFLTYPCRYENIIIEDKKDKKNLSSYWFLKGIFIGIVFLIIYYNLVKFY
jgi:hypothetical protein